MARLSPTEQSRLGRIRPELMQALLWLLDAATAQLGFTLAVPDAGGFRSIAKQQALYADSIAQGGGVLAYPVATPGNSRHNYGAAFDVHIVAGGTNDDGTGDDGDYERLAEVAETFPGTPGLRAGYYFPERSPGTQRDPFHFQLDESLDDSRSKWAAMQKAGIVTAGIVAILAVGAGLALAR